MKTQRDGLEIFASQINKSKSHHTPMPWIMDKFNRPVTKEGDFLGIPWTGGSSNSPEATANAAYIVRAVNAHEELLSLCKDLAKFAPLSFEQRAQSIIAQAEGR